MKTYIIFFITVLLYGSRVIGQTVDTLKHVDSLKTTEQRDLIDVYNWGSGRSSTDSRHEGNFHNAPFPAAGYTLQTGLAVVLSDNLAFSTGDSLAKLSDIATSITYSQYNQIIAPINADIWTKGNKYNIIADWRYMKYPSTTFGLGGHTQYWAGYTIDFSYIKLHSSILRRVSKNLYAGLGFYYDYFWNIREVNPPKIFKTSFEKYGLTNTETAVGPAVQVVYDSRINPINAYNGLYANVVFHPSFEWLGSDANFSMMQIDVRKYFSLRKDHRNILALWSFNWLTMGEKTPYLLLPSTGWDDLFNTGRGYIQGRYRGNDMTYLEVEDRITLSRNGLFGVVVFGNVESFKRNLASHYNFGAPGFGGGIRLKLNKHSGANICVDYGMGLDGSRGFAVNLGEVF